jgi:MATE family multidrug resistance protein
VNAVLPRPQSELKSLWRLALPLALAQAGQALMGTVDTAVVGHVNSTAQAAAGLGNSLTFTISFFGMGVMLALDPLVSQAIGAGKPLEARDHLWQGVWLSLVTSVVVMAMTAVVPLALPLFDVEPEVARGAAAYIWVRLPGVPGLLLFVATRSYLSGVGRTSATFWAMVLANVANLGLDLVLVFGAGPIPPLGMIGSAIATTLCTWLQWVVLLAALGRSPAGVKRQVDWKALKAMAVIGVPVGLHFLAESGVFSLTGVLAGRLGATQAAGHVVALNMASLTFCVAAGIGSAASTRVGWAVGAQDLPRARQAGITAFGSVAVFMALAALLFVSIPRVLATAMTNDPGVVAVVVQLVLVCALFQVSDGLQSVGAGVLRGAGETAFTFRVNVIGHWFVGLPVAIGLCFGLHLGVVGLWLGLSAGLTVVAVALVWKFLRLVPAS